MPASRSKRASPNSWPARFLNVLVPVPDTVPCRASMSDGKATSVAVAAAKAVLGLARPSRQRALLAVPPHQSGYLLT